MLSTVTQLLSGKHDEREKTRLLHEYSSGKKPHFTCGGDNAL